MAFEQKDFSGALFKNDRKVTETHPDYTGTCLIDGKDYYISAWIKSGAKGKFFSLSFKPKDVAAKNKASPPPDAPFIDDDLDSIPF